MDIFSRFLGRSTVGAQDERPSHDETLGQGSAPASTASAAWLASLPYPLAQPRRSTTSPENVSGSQVGCVDDPVIPAGDAMAAELGSIAQLDGGGQVHADEASLMFHFCVWCDAEGARLGGCVRVRRAAGWRWLSQRRRYRHVQHYRRSWGGGREHRIAMRTCTSIHACKLRPARTCNFNIRSRVTGWFSAMLQHRDHERALLAPCGGLPTRLTARVGAGARRRQARLAVQPTFAWHITIKRHNY